MAIEDESRGDEIEATGDEAGDTADLEVKDQKTELEDKVEKEDEEGSTTVETKEKHIPKSRFDQAVNKARREAEAATKRADELEAKVRASEGKIDAAKVEEEIEALEDDLEKAIADGNAEAKKRIRSEIRAKSQSLADSRAQVLAAYSTAQAIEQVRYDALVGQMEAEHPELSPDNEDVYDQDVVDEITEFKEAFEAKGLSSSEALKKSLKAVFRGGTKPEAEKDETKKDEAKTKADERTAAAVKKGIETKGKQPADKKAGSDSDKAGKTGKPKDAEKLTDKDFDKLSKEELASMRGDSI